MKKKLIIIGITSVLIVYLAFNWKSLLLGFAGYKYPKIESMESVSSWTDLKTKHDVLAVASTRASFNFLQQNMGVPGIMVFDKNGKAIISNRGEGCQITARNKLKDLGTTGFQKSVGTDSSGLNLDSLWKRISKTKTSEGPDESSNDYTVVYTWAKYLTEQSREMMNAVNEGLGKGKSKVLLVSLNLDYMDTWTNGELGDKIELK